MAPLRTGDAENVKTIGDSKQMKLPVGFASHPPRAFPKQVSSFQNCLGSKNSLKILLFLNSKHALRRGSSAKAVAQFCRIACPTTQLCIARLEKQNLIVKDKHWTIEKTTRYSLSRRGHFFLAKMFASSASADPIHVNLILCRCRLMMHLRNRAKLRSKAQQATINCTDPFRFR